MSSARRSSLVALLAAVATLAAPAAAGAHLRTSRVAVDYRATVAPLPAPLAGAVRLRIYAADLAVGLTALGGHHLVVRGYLGEPFLRLGPDGFFVNEASATAAGTGLARTLRRGAAHWALRSQKRAAIWHDARVRRAAQGRWSIPVVVDGRQARLEGTIRRVRRPSVVPWLAIGVAFALLTAVFLLRRPQGLLRTATAWLGAVAAVATLVTAIGLAASSTASEGTWVESGNEIVLSLVGLGFLLRGSRDARALAGGLVGMLAVAAGATRLPVLLHGIALSALPGQVARTAVVLAISAGTAAAILGVVVFFDVLEHYDEPLTGGLIDTGRSNSV
jgi:hypothetical protein